MSVFVGGGGGYVNKGGSGGVSFQGLLLLFLIVAKVTLTHEGHESLTLEDQKYLPVTAFVDKWILKIQLVTEYIFLFDLIINHMYDFSLSSRSKNKQCKYAIR